jgi:1-acyl-sn-glycerol-3-phosphate acyltransferase
MRRAKKKAKMYRKMPTFMTAEDRYHYVYKIAKRALFLLRVSVKKDDNFSKISQKPTLMILNHKSNVDPIVLLKILHELNMARENKIFYAFLSKIETHKNPKKFVASTLDLIDTIYIDRQNPRAAYAAFSEQDKAVKDGKSVIIFIEGTRHFGDEFGEFKSAALKVAFKNLIPIQPIVIAGSSGLMDSNKTNKRNKRTVYIETLPAVKPSEFMNTSEDFVCNKIKKEMQKTYDNLIKKNFKK